MDRAHLDGVFRIALIEDHLGKMPGAVHVLGAQRQCAALVIGRARLDAIHSGRAADLAMGGDSQSAESDYARHLSDWLFFRSGARTSSASLIHRLQPGNIGAE